MVPLARSTRIFATTPPVVHEIVATISWFGTSFELVEWLAKRLQFASEQLAQEHKDREIIRKAMMGVLEREDKRELQRIGKQRDARNNDMAIQLPPLHTSLIEICKEWVATTKDNQEL